MHVKFSTPVFVPYDAPLLAGRLVDRRDRFIAEVSLDGAKEEETVLAHCINPGRMEAFVEIGARVWLLPAARAERKLQFSWEAIEARGIDGQRLICSTNTVRPNRLVRALLEARVLKGLDDFATVHALPCLTPQGRASREKAVTSVLFTLGRCTPSAASRFRPRRRARPRTPAGSTSCSTPPPPARITSRSRTATWYEDGGQGLGVG